MDIQINTDHNIPASADLDTHVTSVVENALDHLRDQVTRVEAHLSDENASKDGPDDKCCVLEVSLEDHLPVAVTHYATSLNQSVEGAAHKLTRLLDTALGRQPQLGGEPIAAFEQPLKSSTRPDGDEAVW